LSVTPETSYQGYRSIKCVTPGSVVGEGLYVPSSATGYSSYSESICIKLPVGATLQFTLHSAGGSVLKSAQNITGTGDWQEIKVDNIITTTSDTNFRIYMRTIDTVQAITFYVDQLMLETGSTAHDWAYGGSSYSTYKMEQGCLIEEAHTNLLTANQSTCTDTLGDTTGFGMYKGTETVTSTTEESYFGERSLKVETPGNEINEGGGLINTSVTESTSYTYSAWVKMEKGVPFGFVNIERSDADGWIGQTETFYTGTGNWQFITVTRSYGATGKKSRAYIRTITQQTTTFYIDMLQLTATGYPLSWTLGGTTQEKETLTAPSSVLNIDTEGTGEMTFESEVLIRDIATTKNIIYFRAEPGKERCTTEITRSATRNLIYDATGRYKLREHSSTPNLNTFCKIASTQKEGELNIFQNGIKSEESYMGDGGTGILTASPLQLYLGGHALGTQKINGLLRNVVISKTKRTDPDITARAESELPVVDEHCTMIYPLVKDLSAYKVVAK